MRLSRHRSKTLRITSVFPADIHTVFGFLQRLETLQNIAKPYATFEPIAGSEDRTGAPERSFSLKFRVFGIINLGDHEIQARAFSEQSIYTNERNRFCPVWNHRIILRAIDGHHTEHTDEVEIEAGRKTGLVYAWAKASYRHRQRKWLTLLGQPA